MKKNRLLVVCGLALIIAVALATTGIIKSSSAKDAESKASDSVTSTDESSSPEEDSSAPEDKIVDLKALAEQLAKGDSELNKTVFLSDKLFEKNCKNLYECEATDLTDAVIMYNGGGGKANEISIIKRADGDADKAIKLLQGRQAVRYMNFDGYVPEELPKIDGAKIFSVGKYAVLIISDEAATLETLIREALA